jgi:hypothetical protein
MKFSMRATIMIFGITALTSCGSINKKTDITLALSAPVGNDQPSRQVSSQPESRTTTSGHVFTQVTNHPELGNSVWKDEGGLIWGDLLVKDNGKAQYMDQHDAIEYCKKIGATLPREGQFEQLARDLGKGSESRYEPEFMPNLAEHWFWSSTVNSAGFSYGFQHGYGAFDYGSRNHEYAVRCVLE